MSERSLQQENTRLRRELDRLRQRIAELEALVPKQAESTPAKEPEKKPSYDVFNPVPGDHAFNALRQHHVRRRRSSWLE